MVTRCLDVGCGFSHFHKKRECLNIDIRKAPFISVICDGQWLPFRSKTFEKVFCSHVIEHVPHPDKLLRELIRVARDFLYVECPHRFSFNAKYDSGNKYDKHLHAFRCSWFHEALKKFPHHIEVHYRFPWYLYIYCEVYLGKN